MKKYGFLAASLFVSGLASAQTIPSTHEDQQPAGQHEAKSGEQRCEQMMHEMHAMMSEMMRMHHGVATHSGHDDAKDKPEEQPKH